MASELINQATSEKLKERDWVKSIEICELVACDPGKAKDVIKTIKKRLKHKHPNTQLYAVLLLEMLMNNCGEHIHKQVVDNELLPILVKIVKKKTDFPVRERIFLLLDASQTALGGVSGKFPQYYDAYYDLVSSGVQFPQHHRVTISEVPVPKTQAKSVPPQSAHVQGFENSEKKPTGQLIPDSSIIRKASSIMEVLTDSLNALDPKHPEGATDVFILDLVEQCSFQKQKVMHLVMTSRDEKVVARAIELNEQLEHVLTCHDSLLSVRPTTTTKLLIEEEKEEEDAECLYRRIQKGKACIEDHREQLTASFGSTTEEKMHRPLIRPLCIQPSNLHSKPQPLCINPVNHEGTKQEILIPPPPAKHIEREKFFREKGAEGSGLTGHVRGLSLYSSNGSSSRSGSTDFGEKDPYGFRD